MENMVTAIGDELNLQKNYLKGRTVSTIYFGGGTPSLLTPDQIHFFLQTINDNYQTISDLEITLEANPDDITIKKANEFYDAGVNRISLGIQSFQDRLLSSMNRIHSASEAVKALEVLNQAGFDNITADVMYGISNQTEDELIFDLKKLIKFNIPHISAYCLTIENKTVFGHLASQNKLELPSEESQVAQFDLLMKILENAGYEHYEISNFCKPGLHSRHNSNYWRFQPYLGVGPSAHSFNLTQRHWNIKSNTRYIRDIQDSKKWFVTEELSQADLANECMLTGIRTKWGCDLNFIKETFKIDFFDKCGHELDRLEKAGLICIENNIITLTKKGKFVADSITEKLYILQH